MRSSPAFSDRRFSLSFFLTTPAKNPRTECCCQLVAFMIAAIVVPLGSCSIFRTVACFDEPRATGFAVPAFVGAGFDGVGALRLAMCFAPRDGLRAFFTALDLGLVVATWLSCSVQRQHHVLPLTRPRHRFGGAAGE